MSRLFPIYQERFKIFLLLFLLHFTAISIAQTIDYHWYTQGMGQKNAREYQAAILSFSQFIQQYPSAYPAAYLQRGITNYRLKNYTRAAEDFSNLCLLEPLHAEGHFNWGLSLLRLNQRELAEQKFNKAIQLDPQHDRAYNERGMIYFQQYRYDEALNDFFKATQINPLFSQACNNAGAARYYNQNIAQPSKKDLKIARDWFGKALAADSSFVLAFRNRATMNIFLQAYPDAIKDLKKAIQLKADDPMIFFYLGVAYADQGQTVSAIQAFEQALHYDTQLSFAFEELGNLYKQQKDYDLAIQHYRKAQKVNPLPSTLYLGLMDYRIALAYAEKESKSQMLEYLKKANKQKIFRDMRVYRDFLKAKELKKFRSDKALIRFTKGVRKGKKDNHFLQPGLGWFRMRK